MSTYNFSTDITLTYNGTTVTDGETVIEDRPIILVNTSDSQKIVYLNFTTAVLLADADVRFVIGSSNITIDGSNKTIDMPPFSGGYDGLISFPGDMPGPDFENIIVRNINITNTGGSLTTGAGWICGTGAKNCTMTNCGTHCPIGETGGGCFGSYSDNCTAIQCTAYSPINNGGGIFGNSCVDCTAEKCIAYGFSSINDGGGIFGNSCDGCEAFKCNSTGNITGGGGIFGNGCIACHARDCYSTGNLTYWSGGIFGNNTNYNADNSTSTAICCYSMGAIGKSDEYNCGGIFGPYTNSGEGTTSCSCRAESCFSTGNIFGDITGSNSGIFANFCNADSTLSTVNAKYCFSLGSIGNSCGGIFGEGERMTAEDCYSHGSIAENAGGIIGINAVLSTASNCYSVGAIGDGGGGIYGYGSEDCSATECYSTGSDDDNAGGIFGAISVRPITTRCYTNSTNFIGTDTTFSSVVDSQKSARWDSELASASVFNSNHWIEVVPNKPYLLVTPYPIIVPIGHGYSYIIQNDPTVTNDVDASTQQLIGYYTNPQSPEYVIGPGIIYGYGFITKTFRVTGLPGSEDVIINSADGNVSFDQLKSFEPIWTCNSEKL